jgi:hypothetical protein
MAPGRISICVRSPFARAARLLVPLRHFNGMVRRFYPAGGWVIRDEGGLPWNYLRWVST